MALAIETERLTLRLRDGRDADWYHELGVVPKDVADTDLPRD